VLRSREGNYVGWFAPRNQPACYMREVHSRREKQGRGLLRSVGMLYARGALSPGKPCRDAAHRVWVAYSLYVRHVLAPKKISSGGLGNGGLSPRSRRRAHGEMHGADLVRRAFATSPTRCAVRRHFAWFIRNGFAMFSLRKLQMTWIQG
jgi:hypothetical protein